MAYETDDNRDRQSPSTRGDLSERVKSLREKTSQLDDTLEEIKENLNEARSDQKD